MIGKSEANSFFVFSFIEPGPVEPWQPPRLFKETIKYLFVSKAFSGPINSSHQPGFLSSSE